MSKKEEKKIKKTAADDVLDIDALDALNAQDDSESSESSESESSESSSEESPNSSESSEEEVEAQGDMGGDVAPVELGDSDSEEVEELGESESCAGCHDDSESSESESSESPSEEGEAVVEGAAEGEEESSESESSESSEESPESSESPSEESPKEEGKKEASKKKIKKHAQDVPPPAVDEPLPVDSEEVEELAEGEESPEEEEVPPEESESSESEEDAQVGVEPTEEMVVEPLSEPDLDTVAEYQMAPFNAEAKSPHWVVFRGGEPLAKICLADQEDPELIRETFCSDAYSNSLLDNIQAVGARKCLVDVKAHFYHAAALKSMLAKQIKTAVKAKLTKKVGLANDTYNQRLAGSMDLVVIAKAKNFYPEPDSLKEKLIKAMTDAGLSNAVEVVEQTFLDEMPNWFRSVVAKAEEYVATPATAMEHIAAAIKGANHIDTDYGTEEEPQQKAAAVESHKPSAGVPLTSYGTKQGMRQRVAEAASEDNYRSHIRKMLHSIRGR